MEFGKFFEDNVTVIIDRIQDRISTKLPLSLPSSPVRYASAPLTPVRDVRVKAGSPSCRRTVNFQDDENKGKKREETGDTFSQRSWTTDSETSWTSRDSSNTSTPDVSPMPSPMRKEFHDGFPSPPSSPSPQRRRSATMDSLRPDQLARRRDFNHNTTATPLKTMFLLSTSSPQHSESLTSSSADSPLEDTTLLTPSRRPSSSWRKAIFNKVCTPQHSIEFGDEAPYADGKLHSTSEVRAMWRKLILESLLLIRMEKENHYIRERQEEGGATLSRKLEYQELTPCLKEITSIWEKMLALHDGDEAEEEEDGQAFIEEVGKTVPKTKLLEYVKKGVPRTLRGQIWLFLMQQEQMCSAVPDSARDSASYEDLLKQLTTHQHAILIDLGRTFPNHPYFSRSLGPGQLELFNLLKAYSLLDTEVGYCQGLSFIVGVLVMHMEEISAFHVLKYLMFDHGLRKQFRPNMMALQLKLYQLTRLLHDRYKNVYDHFEAHEISPTLYAAPWFLTMFASQFPLGFVARVFDMIFIQGIDALFKVALTLIGSHHALILQCDSFEGIVDFLKITLPEMVQVQMERIINQAFELDIGKELQAYEVEYHVLSEEVTFSTAHHQRHSQHHSQHHSHPDKSMSPAAGMTSDRPSRLIERRRSSIDPDTFYRLENQNHALKNQNMELMEKLQQAQSHRQNSEISVLTQQIELDKLKSRIRSLELERTALLTAVTKFRKLIPHEALQQLHLSLQATSSSPFDLPDVSDGLTCSGQSSQAEDLALGAATNAKFSGAYEATCFNDTKSMFRNSTISSCLTEDSVDFVNSHKRSAAQTSKALNFGPNEVRRSASSITSACPVSVPIKHTTQPFSASPSTAPSRASASPSSLTSANDVGKQELSSQATKIPSAEVDFLCPSSSYATQTCTSRSLFNPANNFVTVGATCPEERQNIVTVVVQQSPAVKTCQLSAGSER